MQGFDGALLDRCAFCPWKPPDSLCVAMRSYTRAPWFSRLTAKAQARFCIESLSQLHARIDRWVDANRPYLVGDPACIERAFEA